MCSCKTCLAAVWLVGQRSIFVRNREQLANPPVSLALDGAAIERLTRLVSARHGRDSFAFFSSDPNLRTAACQSAGDSERRPAHCQRSGIAAHRRRLTCRTGLDYPSDFPASRMSIIRLQISWCSLKSRWSSVFTAGSLFSASATAQLSVSSSASSMRCWESISERGPPSGYSSRSKQETTSSNLLSRSR
jgi:hypothetical protein